MTTSVENLIMAIVTPILTNPDQAKITEQKHQHELVINLLVSDEDVGRVIGSKGHVIQAIRSIVYNAKIPEHKRIRLNVVDIKKA